MNFGFIKKFCVLVFAVIFVLLFILWISPIKYDSILFEPHLFPSLDHFFGTDYLGRDLFIRTCFAILNTLFIVSCSIFCSLFFGIIYGAYAGYRGGRVEKNMIALLNIIESIPNFLLIIVFLVLINNLLLEKSGLLGILLALTFTSWVYLSRIVNNETKKIMDSDYIQYAILKKANFFHIIYFHLFPNFKNVIITVIIQKIPYFIFVESFLSFVGIGVQPPFPSLGKMISDGTKNFRLYPLELFLPILVIVFIVFVFNIVGELIISDKKEYV